MEIYCIGLFVIVFPSFSGGWGDLGVREGDGDQVEGWHPGLQGPSQEQDHLREREEGQGGKVDVI